MFIDIIFIILIIGAVFKGYSRGLIIAVFSFVAIIVGLAAAMKFSTVVADWLQNSTHIAKHWLPFIAFALVMVGVILLIRLAANLMQKSVEFMLMGWLNKMGGIILYMGLYITVYSVILFYADKMQLLKPETIQASKTYSFIEPWGPKAVNGFSFIIPFFKDMFTHLETFFESLVTHIK
jgi:membrane protein required for colicin V production